MNSLNGHLLYIDITQVCNIGCSFCMYTEKHSRENMVLDGLARGNLRRLINNKEVKRVSVSGEGEPLFNLKVFMEILSLSNGGVSFEFITSGFVKHDSLLKIYNDIECVASKNNDTCNIRLSSDSYHIEKIQNKPHGISINYFSKMKSESISLSFRSIDTDKEFTRSYLISEAARFGYKAEVEAEGMLGDKLIIEGSSQYKIDYKNIVNPSSISKSDYINLYQYIEILESKYKKDFTLGSINEAPKSNGLDITVKPNGDIFLYGIECLKLGNIHENEISIESLKNSILSHGLVRTLYTVPFSDVLKRLTKNDEVKNLIEKVNNPYWIIKTIYEYDETIIEALGK